MKKRIIMLAAALAAALSGVAETETVDGIEWHYVVEDGKAEIRNETPSTAAITNTTTGVLVIPSSLGGMPVTRIGSSAFRDCSGLTSVEIPNSVTNIGSSAFSGCSGLADVVIPAGVTSLGSLAFKDCAGLRSVAIPQRVCNSTLKSVFPSSYQAITNVVIQDGVTSIGSSAFKGCSALMSVTIPTSVTNIGSSAFSGCSGLTNVVIPAGVTDVGSSVFRDCSSLTSVTIPDGVTNIGSSAFKECSELTSIVIPNSVTNIGSSAFKECGGIRSVAIPQCVCESTLKSVFPSSYQAITNVVIQDGVTSLGSSAFKGCSALVSVTIPASVTGIGTSAFEGCSSLTSVTLPAGVTQIEKSTFKGCSSLVSVKIPDGVTGMGASSFEGCSNLTSVEIPAGVTSIGSSAFKGCDGIRSVAIPQCVCKSTLRAVFPSSYLTITNVVIQDGVTSIGSSAFKGCSSLVSVKIPDGVTGMGASSFEGCSNLTSVEIPAGVTSIGSSAFKGCAGLRGVAIPQCVCESTLKSVFPSSYQAITSVVIQDGVTSIGASAFEGCSSLTSVMLPDGVTSIEKSTFKGCSSLVSVNIPDGVTSIGSSAFYKCSGLTSVTIPTSVTEIGSSAFSGSSGLKIIIFNGDAPKTSSNSFSGVASDCTVRVGRSSVGWGVVIPGTWNGLRIEYQESGIDITALWPSGVEGAASMVSSSVYDGYLYDGNGMVVGLITVKVGKPNTRTKLATVKATVTLGGKRTNLMASGSGKVDFSSAEGPTGVAFKGKKCVVELGSGGMSGYYDSYHIDGALNVFTSKDAADKAVASDALGKWQGSVNVAWPGAQGWNGLSVTIAAKGKAKVGGMLADGTKVSAKGQLIVGEEWCCVPVVVSKKAQMAFNVWLPLDATGRVSPAVSGLADAVVGKPGTLKGGAKFYLDAAMGDAKYDAYLPDGLAVTGGAKWTLPKAGKVQLAKDGTVDAAKLGENPSALKLTYKAKDGSFKGSFKAYADVNGKPKATSVKVTGVLVNGTGYGTATAKGVNASVTIE